MLPRFVMALLCLSLTLTPVYGAQGHLRVEKLVKNETVSVESNVTILLRFTNPFKVELPIRIADKNTLGNNGIDIQCLEYTLPADEESIVAYEPITPYAPGRYTVEAAEVTYTNPATGDEERVESNTLEIEVRDSAGRQVSSQGITTIYRCNGMSMQSTSYSSTGGSFNIQIGGGSSIQQQMEQLFNQGGLQGSPQDRVQNNQLSQNTQTLKKEMERRLQEQEKLEQGFRQNLAGNEEFQRLHQSLLKKGFNLSEALINPKANDTGSFELTYEKADGGKAIVKGEMEGGEIRDMMVQTSKERDGMLEMLRQDPRFQELQNRLLREGFREGGAVFNQTSQNKTHIEIPYTKERVERRITATFINGSLTDVQLTGAAGDEKKRDLKPYLALVLFLALAGWLGWKHLKKPSVTQAAADTAPEPSITDHRAESRRLLEEAKKLCSQHMPKDACERTSQALRLFYSHELNHGRELLNTETLLQLKRKSPAAYRDAKNCLDTCSLVEFAGQEIDEAALKDLIEKAETLIDREQPTIEAAP